MVLTDPPYGTTACKWDSIIPLDKMWTCLKRVIKTNGAIAMTAAQPFTSALVMSHVRGYKHHWIWKKNRGTGFQVAKYRPMMQTEDIIVFTCSGERVVYFPQKVPLDVPKTYRYSSRTEHCAGLRKKGTYTSDSKFPLNIIEIDKQTKPIHPTQKPVALMEYLIKTYTKPGDTVLDFTMGSGTTGVACRNLGRNFIGVELDTKYFDIAVERIRATLGEDKIVVKSCAKMAGNNVRQ